jgi:hypothetical protein
LGARVGKRGRSYERAEVEAGRAMADLKQAVAAGFDSAAQVSADDELDSFQARKDFEELLSKLKRFSSPQSAPSRR